ncbi:hypothetical protein F5Y06DRAFT_296820 [Hypoxylon sp. FL0890]|nr:hypothetical protein F5Y06DRAFT_296820 [Hypoxylon sp. FL0890]
MKQRFSSLDVRAIAHELSASIVTLRVSNIYDLNSKILLFKFAKPEVKKQLLIESGFRCHLTEFSRTIAAAPSGFVQKLRKALRTRRVTAVSEIGTDRIIEFQFSNGLYRIYLEFFAGGNIIFTDNELKILALLRDVPEGEGQEPQRVGLTYSLENRQNYGGVPDLTKERVRDALQITVQKATASAAKGKKPTKKPGDELRRGLATTITEFPPVLVDHAMRVTGFDSTVQPSTVLENDGLLDNLVQSLGEARKVVQEVTSSDTCKGFILAKTKPGFGSGASEGDEGIDMDQQQKNNLLYEDFHPFLPRQFEEDPSYTVLTFDVFNKTVDEFFSSLEGQKLESRLTEREATAKRKLEATKAEHAKRIEGLQAAQLINIRKANAIEANIERVREAMDAINGLIQQGMDWEDIAKLVERERRRNNPVASIIVPPLKLHENTITVLLGEAEEEEEEEEEEEDDDASDTDSVSSEDSGYGGTEASVRKARENRLAVEIDLGLSPYANAREYYGERKNAAVKAQKTIQQSETALKNAEQKIAAELKKGLKQEKPVLQPIRKQFWFEKFMWFISSDGYLVLGGKDAQQNEMLYRRYLKKGDVYVHADLHGAPSVIIKNSPSTPDAPIPPSTLSQAGSLAVCASSAWDSKAGMGAWWVNADQVSKSAPTGEFLGTGSFMVRGKKNFLPPAQLILGLGLMFRISEESQAKHVKHRLYDIPESLLSKQTTAGTAGKVSAGTGEGTSAEHDESDSEDSAIDVEETAESRENPLQPTGQRDDDDYEHPEQMEESPPIQELSSLTISGAPSTSGAAEPPQAETSAVGGEEREEEPATETDSAPLTTGTSPAPGPSGKSTPQPQKKGQQPKRGQRGKAKKIAAKYKDQDEEDRAAIEALIGAAAGKQKAEAEAKAKAEREAQKAATLERRRAQHQRQQRETAEHEEVRKMMLEEGIETLDAEEAASLTPLDSLVGTPLPGDEILEVIAVCAPYSALSRCKYKVKMQPGAQKKGKAVKEILEAWKTASTKKGVVDEKSADKEKMWPREVELFKALKPEEVINVVPVGKVRLMMSGASGGGGDSKGKGGNKGGGSANRGKKR